MTYTIKLVDEDKTIREIQGVLECNVNDARNTFQGYKAPGSSQMVTVTVDN